MSKTTWIVTVNYRTADLVVDCPRTDKSLGGDSGGDGMMLTENFLYDTAIVVADKWSIRTGFRIRIVEGSRQ